MCEKSPALRSQAASFTGSPCTSRKINRPAIMILLPRQLPLNLAITSDFVQPISTKAWTEWAFTVASIIDSTVNPSWGEAPALQLPLLRFPADTCDIALLCTRPASARTLQCSVIPGNWNSADSWHCLLYDLCSSWAWSPWLQLPTCSELLLPSTLLPNSQCVAVACVCTLAMARSLRDTSSSVA